MKIIAFETSCDETAAAVVENGTNVLSSVLTSSRDVFARTGGVVPEEAARRQLDSILPVLHAALDEASVTSADIDAIAVTVGPGLIGSLVVGTTTAHTLASLWQLPLIGVHHTLGHLSSTWLQTQESDTPKFPLLTLSASGGHTELWYRTSHTQGRLLGRTRDDAAGEAFDKGAAMLGLPYPGGPSISHAGEKGNASAFSFPLPLHSEEGYDFSFSGLKTALKYTIADLGETWEEHTADLAASFEESICRHLAHRVQRAVYDYPDAQELHLVGGVSANTRLRDTLMSLEDAPRLRTPASLAYCTDNAAMIGAAAQFLHDDMGNEAFVCIPTTASLPLRNVLRSPPEV